MNMYNMNSVSLLELDNVSELNIRKQQDDNIQADIEFITSCLTSNENINDLRSGWLNDEIWFTVVDNFQDLDFVADTLTKLAELKYDSLVDILFVFTNRATQTQRNFRLGTSGSTIQDYKKYLKDLFSYPETQLTTATVFVFDN